MAVSVLGLVMLMNTRLRGAVPSASRVSVARPGRVFRLSSSMPSYWSESSCQICSMPLDSRAAWASRMRRATVAPSVALRASSSGAAAGLLPGCCSTAVSWTASSCIAPLCGWANCRFVGVGRTTPYPLASLPVSEGGSTEPLPRRLARVMGYRRPVRSPQAIAAGAGGRGRPRQSFTFLKEVSAIRSPVSYIPSRGGRVTRAP